MTDKIIIVGDVHGRFDYLSELIYYERPDIVIVCGDFGYWPREIQLSGLNTRDAKVYFCDGNHEDFIALKHHLNKAEPVELVNNIFYVPRGTLLTFNDETYLFVGGAESIDKKWRTEGKDWFPEESLTQYELDKILDLYRDTDIDNFITHSCPFFIEQDLEMPDYGFKVYSLQTPLLLEELHNQIKPQCWYFGHFHLPFSSLRRGTHFIGLDMLPRDHSYIVKDGIPKLSEIVNGLPITH